MDLFKHAAKYKTIEQLFDFERNILKKVPSQNRDYWYILCFFSLYYATNSAFQGKVWADLGRLSKEQGQYIEKSFVELLVLESGYTAEKGKKRLCKYFWRIIKNAPTEKLRQEICLMAFKNKTFSKVLLLAYIDNADENLKKLQREQKLKQLEALLALNLNSLWPLLPDSLQEKIRQFCGNEKSWLFGQQNQLFEKQKNAQITDLEFIF